MRPHHAVSQCRVNVADGEPSEVLLNMRLSPNEETVPLTPTRLLLMVDREITADAWEPDDTPAYATIFPIGPNTPPELN